MNQLDLPAGAHTGCWGPRPCPAPPLYTMVWLCRRCGRRGIALLCADHAVALLRRRLYPKCDACASDGHPFQPLTFAGPEGLN